MTDVEVGGINKHGSSSCFIVSLFSAVVVLLIALTVACIVDSYHTIHEGHVGLYFKYGALQDEISYPGVNFYQPFVTDYIEVKVRSQTDTMPAIKTITKDGIENTFHKIQVINRINVTRLIPMVRKYGLDYKDSLIFDRIREALKIYCANNTIDDVYNEKFLDIVYSVKRDVEKSIADLDGHGIEILNLVIPKPEIPHDIADNYKQVKVQWTEQLVAVQQQKTEEIKKHTEWIKALADANRTKDVLEIKIQEKVLDKQGEREISEINNAIVKEREENIANIEKYKVLKEAEANAELYTGDYVKLNMAKALANNTKLYFSGQDSIFGGLLNKIFQN